MARPVRFHTQVKELEIPETYVGEGLGATSLEKILGLARKNCRQLPADRALWHVPAARPGGDRFARPPHEPADPDSPRGLLDALGLAAVN